MSSVSIKNAGIPAHGFKNIAACKLTGCFLCIASGLNKGEKRTINVAKAEQIPRFMEVIGSMCLRMRQLYIRYV